MNALALWIPGTLLFLAGVVLLALGQVGFGAGIAIIVVGAVIRVGRRAALGEAAEGVDQGLGDVVRAHAARLAGPHRLRPDGARLPRDGVGAARSTGRCRARVLLVGAAGRGGARRAVEPDDRSASTATVCAGRSAPAGRALRCRWPTIRPRSKPRARRSGRAGASTARGAAGFTTSRAGTRCSSRARTASGFSSAPTSRAA